MRKAAIIVCASTIGRQDEVDRVAIYVVKQSRTLPDARGGGRKSSVWRWLWRCSPIEYCRGGEAGRRQNSCSKKNVKVEKEAWITAIVAELREERDLSIPDASK